MLNSATVAAIRQRIAHHEDLARRWTAVLEHLDAINKSTESISPLDVVEVRGLDRLLEGTSGRSEGGGLLSTRRAAAYLGLAVQTLAKMRVSGGSPPFYKLGHRVFYKRDELDAWVSTRGRRSTSDPGSHRRHAAGNAGARMR